jgi:hypothetical protein
MVVVPSIKKVRSIYLDAQSESGDIRAELYFCSRCRSPIIQYQGSVIQEVPGHPPYKPYTILKCKGKYLRRDGRYEECGRYYCFVTAVYTKYPESTE